MPSWCPDYCNTNLCSERKAVVILFKWSPILWTALMKLKIRKMLFFHHINSIYSQSEQAALKAKVDRVLHTVLFIFRTICFYLFCNIQYRLNTRRYKKDKINILKLKIKNIIHANRIILLYLQILNWITC